MQNGSVGKKKNKAERKKESESAVFAQSVDEPHPPEPAAPPDASNCGQEAKVLPTKSAVLADLHEVVFTSKPVSGVPALNMAFTNALAPDGESNVSGTTDGTQPTQASPPSDLQAMLASMQAAMAQNLVEFSKGCDQLSEQNVEVSEKATDFHSRCERLDAEKSGMTLAFSEERQQAAKKLEELRSDSERMMFEEKAMGSQKLAELLAESERQLVEENTSAAQKLADHRTESEQMLCEEKASAAKMRVESAHELAEEKADGVRRLEELEAADNQKFEEECERSAKQKKAMAEAWSKEKAELSEELRVCKARGERSLAEEKDDGSRKLWELRAEGEQNLSEECQRAAAEKLALEERFALERGRLQGEMAEANEFATRRLEELRTSSDENIASERERMAKDKEAMEEGWTQERQSIEDEMQLEIERMNSTMRACSDQLLERMSAKVRAGNRQAKSPGALVEIKLETNLSPPKKHFRN